MNADDYDPPPNPTEARLPEMNLSWINAAFSDFLTFIVFAYIADAIWQGAPPPAFFTTIVILIGVKSLITIFVGEFR